MQQEQVDLSTISEMGDLISAIGSLTKGFPDYDGTQSPWRVPFKTTLEGILVVLSRYNSFVFIRSSVRFAIQRMTSCMGPEILGYIAMFLERGMLGSESSKEITDFLPFLGLTIHKFQVSMYPNFRTLPRMYWWGYGRG